MKRAYLFVAIAGAVVAWAFFGSFFAVHGPDIPAFVRALFVNGAAGGFAADLLMSIGIFWVWSFLDARRHGVPHWWVVLPAASFVGLVLAMPLYFYLRHRHLDAVAG
ncbi:DUF2834 domain-containing protein [Devosia sp. Root635]|uniref:DUF2834 domain-containing protein n=1 Tax=Devosia sp. Root635 TaxID=1736575 RepID=UPI0009E76DAA|nr:DUF2834 domain-containing protein [Devosia sp. Root635]